MFRQEISGELMKQPRAIGGQQPVWLQQPFEEEPRYGVRLKIALERIGTADQAKIILTVCAVRQQACNPGQNTADRGRNIIELAQAFNLSEALIPGKNFVSAIPAEGDLYMPHSEFGDYI